MSTSFSNSAGTGIVVADGFTGAVNGTLGATTPATASVTDLTVNGIRTEVPQILAAAGASQGTAAAITKSRVIVTVTASTQGVKLPTAATGKVVSVNVGGTVGVLVYPGTSDKISTASTNAAVLLAADKGNIYIAKDAVTWLVTKGA